MVFRFAKLPWWLWSLILAVCYAAVMMWLLVITDDLSGHDVFIYAPAGIAFGLVLGPIYARASRQRVAVIDDLPEDKQRAAERASRRGPAPADQETHRGALMLTEHRLGVIERSHVSRTVMMSVFLAGSVALSVLVTAWFAVMAVIFATGIVSSVRQRSQYRRRVVVLSDGFVR